MCLGLISVSDMLESRAALVQMAPFSCDPDPSLAIKRGMRSDHGKVFLCRNILIADIEYKGPGKNPAINAPLSFFLSNYLDTYLARKP